MANPLWVCRQAASKVTIDIDDEIVIFTRSEESYSYVFYVPEHSN